MSEDLSPEAAELVRRARRAPGPDADQRAQLRDRLATRVALQPDGAAPRDPGPPWRARLPRWLRGPMPVVGLAVVGVVAAIAVIGPRPKPRGEEAPNLEHRTAPRAAIAEPPPEPVQPPATAATSPEPAHPLPGPGRHGALKGSHAVAAPPQAPTNGGGMVPSGSGAAPTAGDATPGNASATPGGRSPTPTPAPEPVGPRMDGDSATLDAELAALQGALKAAQGERWGEALIDVAAYRRAFPRGVLRVEFDALEVLGLCGLERIDEAQHSARRLVVSEASSNPAVQRLRSSCAAASFVAP